jgi:hypothetical protein
MRIENEPSSNADGDIRYCKANIYDALLGYLATGRITDPQVVNLLSFDPKVLRGSGVEYTGDGDEFSMYHVDRYFPLGKSRLISTEFKLYYFKERLWTNGFGIGGVIRLVSLLNRVRDRDKRNEWSVFPISIYCSDDGQDGAIICASGIVVRFATQQSKTASHYHVRTLESNFSAIEGLNTREINANAVKAMFKAYSAQDMNSYKTEKTYAFRKLCDWIEECPELVAS